MTVRALPLAGTKMPTHEGPAAAMRLAAMFLLIGLMSGCGGGGGDDDTSSEGPVPEPADSPAMTVSSAEASESDGRILFPVTLAEPAEEPVSFEARPEAETADAGADFSAGTQSHTIPVGEQTVSVTVQLVDDDAAEPLEALILRVGNVEGAVPDSREAVGTVFDDDAEAIEPYDAAWSSEGVFAPASLCAECHRASPEGVEPAVLRAPEPGEALPSPTGEDISPPTGRRHSIMAHSFDDPYFLANMAEESALFSDLAGMIEDKCLTCHAPMAHTHAHQTGTDLDADGHYRAETAFEQMHARAGVSCTLCHQIQDDGDLGTAFSGDYTIDDDPESLEIFGPFQNPRGRVMERRSGYAPVAGSHIRSSAVCATCHNLYTPTLDAETGEPTGDMFLEQGPYFEWQNSDYVEGGPRAASCQQCHMDSPDPESYATRLALRPNGTVNTAWPQRWPYFAHEFTGGNTQVLAMLRDFRDLLGIAGTTTEAGFNEKIAETREMLRSAATLGIDAAEIVQGHLEIDVTITNHTGHKLPTSFPSRRMWLELKVTDEDGEQVFASGVPNEAGYISTDQGHLADRCVATTKEAEFDNSGCYEPHRDMVTDDGQIAIYEPVMGDTNGSITYVLLKADRYLKDNRIPPSGFRTDTAAFEPDTAPVGVAGDPDFNAADGVEGSGTDTVHYRIALSNGGRALTRSRLVCSTSRPAQPLWRACARTIRWSSSTRACT